MRLKRMTVLAATTAVLVCAAPRIAQADEADPTTAQRLAAAENRLGFGLLKQLESPDSNVFVSPTSVHMALSMTYNGATGNTKAEMAKVLGVDLLSLSDINSGNRDLIAALSNDDDTVGSMTIANSLWIREGIAFRAPFLNAATSYDARAESVNMNAPDTLGKINGWVKQQTDGKIPSIIDHIDRGSTIFLLNAVHFKAAWQKPFKAALTAPATFKTCAEGDVQVPMMQAHERFDYVDTDSYQAVALPYRHYKYAMYVVLPKPGHKLASVASEVSADGWDRMRKSLTEVPGEVDLPKFQITYSQSLVKSLQALGMHDAFQSGVAEFDSMIDPPYHLSISDVKHKTYLAVDEDGTEAAAATSVEMVKSLARPSHIEPFKMVVDHPFLCAIVNRETSAIAFLGEINDPTAK